jgi:hypothetical protein
VAPADQRQHIQFPPGELADLYLTYSLGGFAIGVEHPRGDRRIQITVPVCDRADRPDEFLGRGVLEHETGRSGAQHPRQQVVLVEGGQREDRWAAGRGQSPGGLDTVDPLHPQVHHHHVHRLFGQRVENLVTVGAFGHDHEPVLAAQNPAQTGAHQILVIDQQYRDIRQSPVAALAPDTHRQPPHRL